MTDMAPVPDALRENTNNAARVSLLGHDLRAAVSDVIGGLRLIDQTGLDSNTRLQLERVRAAGESLARLLEQELAMLQGEGAAAEGAPGDGSVAANGPAQGNVHVARLLHDLEMRWAGRAQEKGLGFRMTVAADVPRVMSLDRIALERVTSNVLSNAVKYTDAGEIRMAVTLDAGGALRLEVCDDGPGFSDEALDSLFVGGVRPDGRGKPGLGLGLRIAKDMMNRLGGQIHVTNAAQNGASVLLVLPRAAWEPQQASPTGNRLMPDLSQVRVLLADDSLTNQAVIGNMLAALGAEYEVASDGVEAMHWLDRQRFDVALLDIEMPRLSGLELLRLLRAQAGPAARTPVLAITAYVLRANREAIYAAGANGILAKPVLSMLSFGQAIERVLGRSHALATGDAPAVAASPEGEIDLARFANLMVIAGPVAALELLRRLTDDLRLVERGLIAATSSDQPDMAEVRAHTHVLISLAGAVGAEPLQLLAQRLNDAAHLADSTGTLSLAAPLLRQLDHLIHFISNQRAIRQQVLE